MPTLSQFLPDVLGRIEELMPPNGPTFWSLQGEVYVQMVYAMFEAALVTGNVQTVSVAIDLAPNTTYFNMQGTLNGWGTGGFGQGGWGGTLVPAGLLAPIRMKAPSPIRKTSLKGLDDMKPGWQQEAPGSQIKNWFPLGVSLFGIYPQLSADQTVIMDFISSPVNEYRPYTGNETSPFQHEFNDLMTKYAAAMLRTKEGGAEAEEADTVYKDYMDTLKDLSLFQQRVDSLVYTGNYGWKSGTNPKTQA